MRPSQYQLLPKTRKLRMQDTKIYETFSAGKQGKNVSKRKIFMVTI